MSLLDPALEAALAADRATIFGAIRMALPGRTVRLLVGSGFVDFLVDVPGQGKVLERFTSEDEVVGTFTAIDTLTDGLGDEAPALSLTFTPRDGVAAAQLASVAMQGAPVLLWVGALDQQTGRVIGQPLLLFNGLLDTATLSLTSTSRKVEYEVTSIFEDFFLSDDGVRLSDSFHQYVWPGELGCAFVTYVAQQIYWGTSSPDGVRR